MRQREQKRQRDSDVYMKIGFRNFRRNRQDEYKAKEE